MKKGKKWVLLWPGLSLLLFAWLSCASTETAPAAALPPEEGPVRLVCVEERDLAYATVDGKALMMDVIYPEDVSGKRPLVVFIHGSEHSFSMVNKVNFYHAAVAAAERGYVAATINYRTTREQVDGKTRYEFPAQVHDAKCAIRWLRANAQRFGIDGSRVGLVGSSSGGCLALLVGLTDPSCGLEGELGDLAVSSRVQAVVNLAGEADAVMQYAISYVYYRPLLGGTPESVPERYRSASPVTYVSADDPPVLTIIGGEDDRLPQLQMLDAALKGVGVGHTLIVVPGVSHYPGKLVDLTTDGPVWEFLGDHLRGGG